MIKSIFVNTQSQVILSIFQNLFIKINFINGFADFLYETKYMLDQSRLSGVPINIILEDGRPDLENDDF